MKTILQLVVSAAVITAAAMAQSLNPNANQFGASSETGEPSGLHLDAERVSRTADFAISKFDKAIVNEFSKAWQRSLNGTSAVEGVVVILRMGDGTYKGKELGSTNEIRRFTFRWHPATVAVVHTHPNASDPKPRDEDLFLADHHDVPVFTITSRGMYVYEPGTKKVRRVLEGLDWLDASKFSNVTFARQQ
jgi:hypothetical protein